MTSPWNREPLHVGSALSPEGAARRRSSGALSHQRLHPRGEAAAGAQNPIFLISGCFGWPVGQIQPPRDRI